MKTVPAALFAGFALTLGLSFPACLDAQNPPSAQPAPSASTAPAASTAPPASTASAAQTPAGAPLPTLQARAKLVIVDVVVTDGNHHAIHGLKKDQFTLLEDRKPETIKAFEEHSAPTAAELAKYPPLPKLPPGIFSNYVPAPSGDRPVNVLLLDALNTPISDQQYVRSQLLDYLKHEQPGTSIAIFGLSSQLVMLQGFTSDPNQLRQVVEKQGGKGSIILDNTVGGEAPTEALSDQVADLQQQSPGAGLQNTGPTYSDIVSNLKTFEDMQQTFEYRLRIQYTLDAMNELARYLSNIPGRKNLIWFSGSFPLNILPTAEGGDPFASQLNMEHEYHETTNLLVRAQVAVYPVDARGLQTSPVFNAANAGSRYSNPSAFTRDVNRFNQANVAEHQTMATMASDTGGQAFFNTNGLSQAVSTAIEDGSNYYTLAYTPTDARYKNDFRHIEVKLAAPGYSLSYRRGYYADDPDTPGTTTAGSATPAPDAANADALIGESLMQKAMQHGVPGSTQIVYTVRVLPDAAPGVTENDLAPNNVANGQGFSPIKPPYRRYRVDFGVDPSNIVFTTTPDGVYHGAIDFDCFLYDPDGRVLNSVSNKISLALPAARYLSMMKTGGITFHQEISAPAKGDTSLRTGVHDLTSNHIGSAEIPLSLVKNLPPLPVQPQPPAK